MEAIIECAAGLDVHQATVVACVVATGVGRKLRKEIRTFGTMTRDLDCLRAWLSEHAVTHVGMESTGVYWMPVYAALEGSFTLIVGNAHHIRNVPGRKTDAKDAEWLAELVRHGLIRPSFVPSPELRELRDLLRHRRSPQSRRTRSAYLGWQCCMPSPMALIPPKQWLPSPRAVCVASLRPLPVPWRAA